jgi:3-hydroxyisobutyrate dehydrogenase
MQRVAIIGLGTMGAGMAANWLAKGFEVSVYNRTRAKAEPLGPKGARIADTPRAAAEGADFVAAMVADDGVSRSVWTGPDGALAGLKRGAIAIESSTLTPEWIKELAELVRAKGGDLLDAPVGGSRAAANDGKLVLFVGGDAATLAKARGALEAVGQSINHLGPTGAGATWKLINNLMGAAHLAVLSEALTLAAKAGIDRKQAEELIKTGVSASPMVLNKIGRISEQRYEAPDFSLKLMQKDVGYAEAMARKFGLKLEMVEAVDTIYRRAAAKGLGELDVAAVIQAVFPKATP